MAWRASDVSLTPCYFLDEAAAFKAALNVPVLAVGGFRKKSEMEAAITEGKADLVSLARPFVREPKLPRRLENSDEDVDFACESCNRCYVAVGSGHPLRCYCHAGP